MLCYVAHIRVDESLVVTVVTGEWCWPQVVRDAPWEYDEAFLEKHKIDFVAHDDIPYTTENCDDTYAHIKAKDMFVATERTEGQYCCTTFSFWTSVNW